MDSIEAYMEKFKEEYRLRLDSNTLYNIQLAMNQLLAHCEKSVSDIQTRDVRHWLMHLHTNEYAQATVRRKLYNIKTFFRYCLEEEIISQNPLESMSIPEDKQKIPRYLETDQLEKLRKLASRQVRQRAIVEVLYATGVRVGELCAMNKEDIHWSEQMIHIPNGKGKKGRMVLFTKECEEHLKAYLQERKDDLPFLFLNRYQKGPITIRAIQFFFETYRKELGIHMSPHTLRHTFAAHLAKKGMPLECIQVLLGHDEPRHTELYARLYNQARKEKYDEWM